jgi:methyl-accepting chemotaxis protein
MKFRRRKYVINSGLQMRFSFLFIIVALLGNILAVGAFNMFSLKKLDAARWSTHLDVESTGELLYPVFLYVNIGAFLFITLLFIIIGAWMLRKTTGPLIRMSKDIKRVTEGDLSSQIVLRQKDEFKDVADELNIMTEKLRGRFINIKDKYASISQSVAMLEKGPGDKEVTSTAFNSILKNIEGLEAEINEFRLP